MPELDGDHSPVVAGLLVGVRSLHADLSEDADEELVDVVVDAHRDLYELGAVRTSQALAV